MIFITGIAGFVGSHLANELFKRGYNVTGCDNLQFGYKENVNPGMQWQNKCISQLTEADLIHYPVMVHCATANIQYAADNHIDTFRTNALESIYLIKKFKGKIIYTSTASVYGNPKKLPVNEDDKCSTSNAYDQSKLITELYLKLRGNYTTLRLSNVYGDHYHPEKRFMNVVSKFIDSVDAGLPVEIVGDGIDTRDFTYINDTIDAIIKAIDLPALNTEINVSSGVETSIINLAYKVHEILQEDFKATFVKLRSIDGIRRRWLDNSKAKELLNWSPRYTLEAGLRKTILQNASIYKKTEAGEEV